MGIADFPTPLRRAGHLQQRRSAQSLSDSTYDHGNCFTQRAIKFTTSNILRTESRMGTANAAGCLQYTPL